MKTIIENRASVILYNIIRLNNLKKGTIMLPANICPIVPAILMKCGNDFMFFDIHKNDYLPDLKYIINKIKKVNSISAVLYNHTLGFEKEVEDNFEQIKSINPEIFIINDCCIKKPSTTIMKTAADLTLFSTGYSKYIDLSYGGYAFTRDNVIYHREMLDYSENDHNKLTEDFYKALKTKGGFNYIDNNWLDARQPEIDKENYFNEIDRQIDEVTIHKRNINNIYLNNINEKFHLGDRYNDWRFNIMVDNKEFVLKQIFKNNLFASSHYQSLNGIFGDGIGINAQYLHSRIINLFNDFRFDEKQALLISNIINKYAE